MLKQRGEYDKLKGYKITDDARVDLLEKYHEDVHIKATPFLQILYKAVIAGEKVSEKEQITIPMPGQVQTARNGLAEINKDIMENNSKIGNQKKFGIINIDEIIGKWRANIKVHDPHLLWILCTQTHYPLGWAKEPPGDDNFEYDTGHNKYYYRVWNLMTDPFQKFFQQLLNNNWDDQEIVSIIQDVHSAFQKAMEQVNEKNNRPSTLYGVRIGDIIGHYCGMTHAKQQENRSSYFGLRAHLRRMLVAEHYPLQWLPKDYDALEENRSRRPELRRTFRILGQGAPRKRL